MHLPASLGLLALVLQGGGPASLPEKRGRQSEEQPRGNGDSNTVLVLHPANATLSPDGYDELIDLSDYWDQVLKVRTLHGPGSRLRRAPVTSPLLSP